MKNETRNILCVAMCASLAACNSGPSCTTEPQSSWLSKEEMQARIAALGYKVKEFKISGQCYEIYGWDRDGKKVEVYFDPTDGDVFKSKVE